MNQFLYVDYSNAPTMIKKKRKRVFCEHLVYKAHKFPNELLDFPKILLCKLHLLHLK